MRPALNTREGLYQLRPDDALLLREQNGDGSTSFMPVKFLWRSGDRLAFERASDETCIVPVQALLDHDNLRYDGAPQCLQSKMAEAIASDDVIPFRVISPLETHEGLRQLKPGQELLLKSNYVPSLSHCQPTGMVPVTFVGAEGYLLRFKTTAGETCAIDIDTLMTWRPLQFYPEDAATRDRAIAAIRDVNATLAAEESPVEIVPDEPLLVPVAGQASDVAPWPVNFQMFDAGAPVTFHAHLNDQISISKGQTARPSLNTREGILQLKPGDRLRLRRRFVPSHAISASGHFVAGCDIADPDYFAPVTFRAHLNSWLSFVTDYDADVYAKVDVEAFAVDTAALIGQDNLRYNDAPGRMTLVKGTPLAAPNPLEKVWADSVKLTVDESGWDCRKEQEALVDERRHQAEPENPPPAPPPSASKVKLDVLARAWTEALYMSADDPRIYLRLLKKTNGVLHAMVKHHLLGHDAANAARNAELRESPSTKRAAALVRREEVFPRTHNELIDLMKQFYVVYHYEARWLYLPRAMEPALAALCEFSVETLKRDFTMYMGMTIIWDATEFRLE